MTGIDATLYAKALDADFTGIYEVTSPMSAK